MSRHVPEHLATVLDELGYAEAEGLVTAAPGEAEISSRSYLWRDLRDRVRLDAAFFHDGVPLVGFSEIVSEPGLRGLRKRLWNYGRVPLLIVCTPTGVEAYNALSRPEMQADQEHPLLGSDRKRSISRGLLDAFSRRSVEAGRFATQFADSYKTAKRVDQGLLINLRFLRRKFGETDTASKSGIDALVGASLIASYLVDRGVLTSEHMTELCGVESLDTALRHGKRATVRLFNGLAQRFNGDVFGGLAKAVSILDNQAFAAVANLLHGDHLPSRQAALWPYDFSVLPPDLVSSVYEQLLEDQQKKDSAYYTPRSIVDTVLDEIISWTRPNVPTLVDLACGSGAFMTEAFRRLAFKERTKKGRQLTYPELRSLLTKHIFGIDRNPTAAGVAAFGMYLALLEEVDPPTIWESVTLPKLVGKNILVADAFEEHALRHRSFDIIVSNPPWIKTLSEAAGSFVKSRKLPIGNNQIAQAFVWLATDMLKPGGRLGLVLPAKSILHNRSSLAQQFRSSLFSELDVRVIVDLSPIRRNLFPGAIAPSSLVIADKPSKAQSRKRSDQIEEIIHAAVHPRPFLRAAGALVISPEDLHVISSTQARVRPDIWKVLVWGTVRDLDFLDRMRGRFDSLGDVVEERGWTTGQGFKEAARQPQVSASHLIGLPRIEIDSILPLRRPKVAPAVFDKPTLHRPRNRSQYKPPQVLVRRTLPNGRLAATVLTKNAIYSSELISINGSPEDADELIVVAATIASSLGNYWHFMTSASWGIERDTVELNELLAMPIPKLTAEAGYSARRLLKLSSKWNSDRLRDAMDELVFDLFNLSGSERRRIQEGMAGAVARFEGSEDYQIVAEEDTLTRYRQTLTESLRNSFPDVHISTEAIRQDSYVVVWIKFELAPDDGHLSAPDVAVDTEAILRGGQTNAAENIGLVALPAAFLIDEDTVYLVKTADGDRWSYDAALNDADRIFAALAFGTMGA